MTLRSILSDLLDPLPEGFIIATSGGIDSNALLVTAHACKKNPVAISFTLADRESADFKTARRIADSLGVEFLPVRLPTDPDEIVKDVRFVIAASRLSGKAHVECTFPFLHVFRQLRDRAGDSPQTLVTGGAADGHFGVSKRAMIHYRYPTERFQEFRRGYFDSADPAQTVSLPKLARRFNIDLVAPYTDRRVFDLWATASWDDLNKPRQKEAIRSEFPELDRFRLRPHTNLQLGDSGIAETVGRAALDAYAPKNKNAVAAYNRILKATR